MKPCGPIVVGVVVLAWGCLAPRVSGQTTPGKLKASQSGLKRIDFNRDVRPILSEHCYPCHGPDAAVLQGNLRLDTDRPPKGIDGPHDVIEAGNPDQSALWYRVGPAPAAKRMPPPTSPIAPLTPTQVATLRAWIEQGGQYQTHWSFVPPVSPPRPKVKDAAWVKSGIDSFVLSKLEAAGLKPEPEADRASLIRRYSLTLTGLPPTADEVARFEADDQPGAINRLIDRLLASPRYGEHQARYWLDAVRYGDTHGLHLDNERAIYPYRDWVVRAFNNDLPFDKFATWQLAGDLLPNAATEQKIATGYIRMNPTTNEGGAIEAEFLAKNTFDRVDTFSTVFLGLTVACARCHDHKYDPISMREYYRLFAFFNSTADRPLDGNELAPAPAIRARTPEQDRFVMAMESQLRRAEAEVAVATAKEWLLTARVAPVVPGAWSVSPVFRAANFDVAYATDYGPEPEGAADTVEWKPIELTAGTVLAGLIKADNAAIYVRSTVTSPDDRESVLQVGSDDAIAVWVNGTKIHDNKVQRGVTQATDTVKVRWRAGTNDVLIKVVNGGGEDGLAFNFEEPLQRRKDALGKKVSQGDVGAEEELRKLYLQAGPGTEAALLYRRIEAELAAFDAQLPLTLVAQELPEPRPAYILRRGEYALPTEMVTRGVPNALGSLPAKAPLNRLGLANWLTQPENPLTARVLVNRVWAQHFGRGLVQTPEDFGSQGAWPSHPELLDYLATRFVAEGWSLKRLHRTILTSATYRQESSAGAAKRQKDPENALYSRGPRYRLDAEVIRDQVLAVSGLLVESGGGKGFKPYQPAGLWEAIAFLESNTSRYVQDTGPTTYRRSLYLFWKRTSPPPTMMAFDAPMRESCVVQRSRTNTPLQALVTLNEPVFVEAARVFAQRLVRLSGDDAARLDHAIRATLGRAATAREKAILTAALKRHQDRFRGEPEAARKLLATGSTPADPELNPTDVAAWTMIASTLFNLDEFLSQR